MNKGIWTVLMLSALLFASVSAQAQTVEGQVTVTGQAPAGNASVAVQATPQVPPPPSQPTVIVQQPQTQPQVVYVQQAPTMVTETEWRPMWGLIIPGIVSLAGSYGLHLIVNSFVSLVSAVGESSGDCAWCSRVADSYGWGFLPGLGPFIQAAIVGDSLDSSWGGWLVSMGLLQTFGIVAIAVGATVGQEVSVTRQTAGGGLGGTGFGSTWHLMPYADPQGGGLQFGMNL